MSSPPRSPHMESKVSVTVSIVAAMVLASVANLLAIRHYKRWDVTDAKLYTLSDGTLQTLHSLEEPIAVHILFGSGEPLFESARELLRAYEAESSRLNVHEVDPDRSPAEYLALQKRYHILPGRSEDDVNVTDAVIIVARGDDAHFIDRSGLIKTDDENEYASRPRLEQAITSGIRSVLTDDKPTVCFARGHGEIPIDESGARNSVSLSAFRDRLVRNNFAIRSVVSGLNEEAPGDSQSYDGCRMIVVAGPTQPFPEADATALLRAFASGARGLFAVSPISLGDADRYTPLGFDAVFGPWGIKLENDFIFERSSEARLPDGLGETFFAKPRPHAITSAFVREVNIAPRVVINAASSLQISGSESALSVPLLSTSDEAFGMRDFFLWSKGSSSPKKAPDDTSGPLVVAAAVEFTSREQVDTHKRSRAVVIASTHVLLSANWERPELRGTALFVENAVSWLTERPALLDIPEKPSFQTTFAITEATVWSVFRYVVIAMPLASVLLAIGVFLRRREMDKRAAHEHPPAKPLPGGPP